MEGKGKEDAALDVREESDIREEKGKGKEDAILT